MSTSSKFNEAAGDGKFLPPSDMLIFDEDSLEDSWDCCGVDIGDESQLRSSARSADASKELSAESTRYFPAGVLQMIELDLLETSGDTGTRSDFDLVSLARVNFSTSFIFVFSCQ